MAAAGAAYSEFSVNFIDSKVIQNPFPIYEQIRACGPTVWNPQMGMWMVTGYDDCTSVLSDTGEHFSMVSGEPDLIFWFDTPNMIQVDGALHVRLRKCLAGQFTRSAVARWEARIREVVDDLLAPLVAGQEQFDIIADFTLIPTVIVADMLGVPEARYSDFRRWSHAIVANHSFGHEDDEALSVLREASAELNDYIASEIERHQRERPEDLITAMLEMPELSDAEVRSTAILFLIAGYDTTAKLLANCLVALEQHPDQRRLVSEDQSLIPGAIEEVMRWSSIAQIAPRRVTRHVVVAGQDLQPGAFVGAMVAAANRDPQRWPDPARFDVRREAKAHLGFGFGPHLCIGAPLARLETRIALERLLAVAPDFCLHDTDYGNGYFTRGLERGSLEVLAAGG